MHNKSSVASAKLLLLCILLKSHLRQIAYNGTPLLCVFLVSSEPMRRINEFCQQSMSPHKILGHFVSLYVLAGSLRKNTTQKCENGPFLLQVFALSYSNSNIPGKKCPQGKLIDIAANSITVRTYSKATTWQVPVNVHSCF